MANEGGYRRLRRSRWHRQGAIRVTVNHVDSNLAPCGERMPPPSAAPVPAAPATALRSDAPATALRSDAPAEHPTGDGLSGSDRSGGEHQPYITEAGSFTTARCGCGWFAPARRSRDKARRDVDKHLAE